jgi:hypothetical protein
MGVVSHHGSCGLSCVKSSQRREGDLTKEKITVMDPPWSTVTHLEEALAWGKHTELVDDLSSCCPLCKVDVWSHNIFVGSDMREFVSSDRKINASTSATMTPCVTHLLGGFVLESYLPVFELSESDDDDILNVVTLLEASSGSFLKRSLGMSDSVCVDVNGAINLCRLRSNQLSWSKMMFPMIWYGNWEFIVSYMWLSGRRRNHRSRPYLEDRRHRMNPSQ